MANQGLLEVHWKKNRIQYMIACFILQHIAGTITSYIDKSFTLDSKGMSEGIVLDNDKMWKLYTFPSRILLQCSVFWLQAH